MHQETFIVVSKFILFNSLIYNVMKYIIYYVAIRMQSNQCKYAYIIIIKLPIYKYSFYL